MRFSQLTDVVVSQGCMKVEGAYEDAIRSQRSTTTPTHPPGGSQGAPRGSRGAQEGPRRVQRESRGVPRGPKGGPRRSQRVSRGSHGVPRVTQGEGSCPPPYTAGVRDAAFSTHSFVVSGGLRSRRMRSFVYQMMRTVCESDVTINAAAFNAGGAIAGR